MRKGLKKTRQAISGFLAVALMVASLPQSSAYSYAAEQMEELISDEELLTQVETVDVQLESEVKETEYSQTEKTLENNENPETEGLEEKSSMEETKEEISETETREEKSEGASTETKTEIQEESTETEELTESEIESETEEQKTEYVNKADLQEIFVKEELTGVYQFGDILSESDGISVYSNSVTAYADTVEIEEYLYQQMKAQNEAIDVQSYNITTDEMSSIVKGVLNENPDLYFVDKEIGYSYSGSNKITIEVVLTYDTSLDDAAFQKAAEQALTVAKTGMSDLEKAIALHDYLAVNCEYDKENYDADTIPRQSYSAYGVLVNRIAVCQGYALAYKYLLNQAGIDCYMVTSKEMNHAWNLIKLDGKFYQVDVTWDDPTWDLIGRTRHEYMFRSDNAFVDECRHYDWSVTKGSEVVDYKATDTSYDNAFWLDCDSPLIIVGKDCYYVAYDKNRKTGVINKTKLSDITGTGETICDIGKWTLWDNVSSFYTSAYSGLFQVNNRLYYNDKTSIYSIALDDTENGIDKCTEFTADTAGGYIYGSAYCQGKVLYCLRQTPNISSKETVLIADIDIEAEESSKIPVEKIELDKETLKLTVGSAAKLQATVTPDNATDANVTWKSSDDTIATVEDGTVTAIAVGSCTITAIAGGKAAVCNVTVIASEDNIASGESKDITWVINADGKLTVEGTGNFAYGNDNMAPWYSQRLSIKSAEINVTGMTNAERMFYGCENLTNLDMDKFDTSNVTDMGWMFYGCSSLESLDVSKFDTSNVTRMKWMFGQCSSLESLNVGKFDTSNVTDMNGMFGYCSNLKSLDVSKFDTSNVTDMECMFRYCEGLESLDVGGFDTSNVTDMSCIFEGCSSLKSLDVGRFNTSKVTDMSCMFIGCSSLESLDVGNFDTGKVTDMRHMFNSCNSLESLDVGNFDTSNVKSMYGMFAGCRSLKSLNMSKFDTSKVIDGMFDIDGCRSLISLRTPCNINGLVNLPKLEITDIWFDKDGNEYEELPQNLNYSILIKKNEIPIISAIKATKIKTNYVCGDTINIDDLTVIYYDVDSIARELEADDYTTNADKINISTEGTKTLVITYGEMTTTIELTVTGKESGVIASGEYKEKGSNITWVIDVDGKLTVEGTGDFSGDYYSFNRAPWYDYRKSIKYAEVNVAGMTSASHMFYKCSNLTSLDIGSFDTSNVTNMVRMFADCSDLTNLDVSGFDTSKVTDMSCMFDGCNTLTSLDVSKFDTSQVMNMCSMFCDCNSLTSLDVSGFDTSQVINMDSMFRDCSSLTSLDVSSFDTSKVTTMECMFYICSNLTNLDMSKFDTNRVTNMRHMFGYCSNLIELDLSNFNTGQVTDMRGMFELCSNLSSLDVSSFNTSQVTNMESMFSQCSNLSSLDVSKFDTSQVTDMCNMFFWCSNLTSLDLSGFDTSRVTDMYFMLSLCSNLTSLDLSKFDTSQVTNMEGMFHACSKLTELDLSGFDTGQVTNMGSMFSQCNNLNSLNLDGFDTSQVTDMSWMFSRCSNLMSLDLKNFNISQVTNVSFMFYDCSNLTNLDMSNFDLSKVEKLQEIIDCCYKLTTIHTPRNLKQSVPLPLTGTETAWYQPDGTEITELPQNLDYSIKITKNKIPTVSDPYITVQKTKKTYECGDILNTNDLTVIYYNSDGVSETVTDYTTNVNEIDMSVPGIKILTVTYNGLTAEVELTVTSSPTTDPDKENYKVTFDLQGHGTALEEYSTYTAIPKGTTITRPTSPEAEGYQFIGWYKDPDCKTLWDFEKDTIEENTTLYAGWKITETDPDPDQQTYTVTFDLQGHGTALEEYATYTAIPKGTTITRPTSPEAEGYQFTGWYKDPDCKTLWDFEKDTIEEDTTLYAGWKLNGGLDDDTPPEDIPDGIWIAQIKDYTYTGKPIIPSVVVYFNKKKLTAGQDYTITYQNNTKAALASAAKAPTVIVKGKGNYAGTKKASFTINKIQLTEESSLKAAKVYPIGVKYTPIVTANGNVLKSGTDYKLAYCDAYGNELKKQPTKAGNYQLHITGKGSCEGEILFSYSVSETGGANMINKGTATVANFIYGSEEPKVTLSVDGKTLIRDTDYIVSFANTYKKGTATATFIGIGDYVGTIKKNFKVQAAVIQQKDLNVAGTVAYEKGGAQADVSVIVNGNELVLGTDYTISYKKNTKIGTASVTIKGKGNYTGSQTKEFKVGQKLLTTDGIKIYVSDVLAGKKPTITVYDTNGKKLSANSDYKAEIDRAAQQVTITAGKNGLYKTESPITISYQELEKGKQITSIAFNKKSGNLPKYFEYTGKEVVLEKDWLTVKAGKNVLKSDEFEIVGYVNNIQKGTATVIIKGCNGYGGIKMLNFKIKAKGLL